MLSSYRVISTWLMIIAISMSRELYIVIITSIHRKEMNVQKFDIEYHTKIFLMIFDHHCMYLQKKKIKDRIKSYFMNIYS